MQVTFYFPFDLEFGNKKIGEIEYIEKEYGCLREFLLKLPKSEGNSGYSGMSQDKRNSSSIDHKNVECIFN